MPPKKSSAPSKKTEEKKKEKIIEDKTFGLKNKKGAKQQKFVAHVSQQVKHGGGKSAKELAKQEEEKMKKKEQAAKAKDELNVLFKPVQSVGKGVDPKSVVCLFFKQGQCTKGEKCKFSHDLAVARKTEKRNVYSDEREEKDNMDDWDEAKLAEVVQKKHGEKNGLLPKSSIICKYFLEAVEGNKYGWFWDCPNGNEKCQYKHALPPGFVLKRDRKKMEEQRETISLEDLVDKERAALVGTDLTKITLDSFLKWKKRKLEEKKSKAKAEAKKKKAEAESGNLSKLTGRDLFNFKPDLALGDDDDAADDLVYERESDDEEDEDEAGAEEGKPKVKSSVKEIDIEELAAAAREVEADKITVAGAAAATAGAGDRLDPAPRFVASSKKEDDIGAAASAAAELDPASLGAVGGCDATPLPTPADLNGVHVDEDLFDADDLDEIDEELETLDIGS